MTGKTSASPIESGLDPDHNAILHGVKKHCERLLDHTPRFKFFTLHGKAHLDSLFEILSILRQGGIDLNREELFILALAITEVQWAHNLPTEAFNGSENIHVAKVLEECFLVHPKPHVHALKHEGIAKVVCRLNKSLTEQYRMWFYPLRSGGNYFVVLGFPELDKGKGLPADLQEQLSFTFTTLDVNGSGIGLYTAKKIVTAHLGWTDASSRDGMTEFFIHLPKKAALKRDLGILI